MLRTILPYVLAGAAVICVVLAWLGRRRRAVLALCASGAVLGACSAALVAPGSPVSVLGPAPGEFKGGIRIVYAIEVGEAIKDRRDQGYEAIRAGLAAAFGLHREGEPLTLAALAQLRSKARVERPADQASAVVVVFVDPADAAKIDEAFLQRHARELDAQRSADGETVTLRIREHVEATIREQVRAQVKETAQRRLEALGVGGGWFSRSQRPVVTVRGDELVVELPGTGERALQGIKEILRAPGQLAFKRVDDESDFFAPIAARSRQEDLPRGMSFSVENAPVGPGRTKPIHYARMAVVEPEGMGGALSRLKEWAATLEVDPDHEIAFGKVHEFDETKGDLEEVGWRTYLLFRKTELGGDAVREAKASKGDEDRGMGWYVALELTPIGGERFAEMTGSNIKRRLAITLDGEVETAPVIQSRIDGGKVQITMEATSPEQQAENARQLEIVLRSGALPARLVPMTEELVPP